MTTRKLRITYGAELHVKEEPEAGRLQEQFFEQSVCSNCRHQGDCVYLARACAPILECDLYECGPANRPRFTVVKKGGPAAADAAEEDDAPAGLCTNCDHLRGCRLPRPAGGVWMCEEYR